MPIEIILIRHGESQHHIKGLTGGWTASPLTTKGERQAKCAAKALAALSPVSSIDLISSDLIRARQTADIIAAHLENVRPTYHQELRELGNGIAKDKTLDAARSLALPVTEPAYDWIPYPEAESWRLMSARVSSFMDTALSQSKAERLLIVSHGNAMVALVQWWLGLGEAYWNKVSFEFDCASFTRLTINRWEERVVSKLNDTTHLSALA
ncbi:MAG: histidine phosphatase family protein [Opitutaceae bacterium]|nr:histidine phosphatase family protein [Cephaloticoccus sp.]MCP5530720.1 histidine phosphatase family protein [Opitutaceae bacterium]